MGNPQGATQRDDCEDCTTGCSYCAEPRPVVFSGHLTSAALSLQLPAEYRDSRHTTLTGTKVVTVHENFGAYTNPAMSIVGTILEIPSRLLFWASHEYLPAEYQANSPEEVGYLVVIRNQAVQHGDYQNGADAYVHEVTVSISNGATTLAGRNFGGGLQGSTTAPSSGEAIGDPPDGALISEWVAQELARLQP